MPLIIRCNQIGVTLILIHEVTYDPKTSQTRPFFYKLYDRIKTIDFVLKNKINTTEKSLLLSIDKNHWPLSYNLMHNGIVFH